MSDELGPDEFGPCATCLTSHYGGQHVDHSAAPSPAPWTWCQYGHDFDLTDAEGRFVGVTQQRDFVGAKRVQPQLDANYYLIARAPQLLAERNDLLAALEACTGPAAWGSCIEVHGENDLPGDYRCGICAKCKARALIARIRGGG